jgi:hypothetical protein
MPPRFVYWTILAGGLPTAFRATDREELLPTFKRILEKHPDATLKYFARGRLWDSPEEAKAELRRAKAPEPRGRDWRPGGAHRDPRQTFTDAKKARNQRWRAEKHARKAGPGRVGSARGTDRKSPPLGRPAFEPKGPRKPHGDPLKRAAAPAPRRFQRDGAARAGAPQTRRFTPHGPPDKARRGDTPRGAFKPRDARAPGPAARKTAPYKTAWQKEQDEKKKRGTQS